MSVRPILTWPDPRLRAPCDPVDAISEDIRGLVADLFDTLYAAKGRGLAAPQVGVLRRIFVMDTTWKEGAKSPRVFVNPEMLWMSPETAVGPEGCLSIPGLSVDVARSSALRLLWTRLDGQTESAEFDGFAAVCIQHELDHLDGRVTFDRLSAEARQAAEAAYGTPA